MNLGVEAAGENIFEIEGEALDKFLDSPRAVVSDRISLCLPGGESRCLADDYHAVLSPSRHPGHSPVCVRCAARKNTLYLCDAAWSIPVFFHPLVAGGETIE